MTGSNQTGNQGEGKKGELTRTPYCIATVKPLREDFQFTMLQESGQRCWEPEEG